ncbi:GCN5 family acetyltransferase [Micromonospora rosaria]|uniref:GCN5 family acetyltransferase n=1 Tax=Micromonospora rosaria TaxID=47874 RepID=A0A136PQ36_9ACTN|nr:GNAT family N-acetyltransferase [Micromonospora rosaria]KXK60589.1 GCN5 family acetyltransferase [Micromonospora rosaria]
MPAGTAGSGPPVLVREVRPADAPAVVALRAAVHPYLVRGVEATRRTIVDPPPGADRAALVAEVAGEVVGWVSAYRNPSSGSGEMSVLDVHPQRRRQGVGGALLDRALAHLAGLGVPRVRAWSVPEALPFAERHGFAPSRTVRFSGLELRPAPPAPVVPAGVALLSVAEVEPYRLYQADQATAGDVPGEEPGDGVTYEFWRYDVWTDPGLDRATSTAVTVDGELAAFSLVQRDGDRMWSDYTGTVPRYRGRGLARLAKQAALHRAAASGIRTAYTSNDEANAPMLAVNTRLGYRPVATHWSVLRDLT